MNKLVKFLGYIGVHIIVVIEVYLLAILIASPFLNIVIGIMDAMCKLPDVLKGKYFVAWLALALLIWLPMYIYVELKSYRARHPKVYPEEKKKE